MFAIVVFVFSALVLSLHLIAVNIATMGPLVCVWLEMRARYSADDMADRLARRLAKICCQSLLVGIALGLVVGAIEWLRPDSVLPSVLARCGNRCLS